MTRRVNIFYAKVEAFSFNLYRFFGIFCLSKNPRRTMEILQTLWSVIVMISLTAGSILISMSREKLSGNPVGKVNDVLKFCCSSIAAWVAIIESLRNIKNSKNFYRKLDVFEGECRKLQVNLVKYERTTLRTFSLQFIFLIFFNASNELLYVQTVEFVEFWKGNILPCLVCRARLVQYIYFLFIMTSKFDIVCSKLNQIVECTRLCHTSNPKVYKQVLDHLQTLKTAYSILWSLIFDLNEMFTWSLTTILIQNFVQMGCDSYWSYWSFSTCTNAYECIREGLLLTCRMVQPTYLIVILLRKATGIQVKASEIPVQVHQIRKRKCDTELYKMVSEESFRILDESWKC
jgi:7tm Chemosensory receptor